MIIRHISINSTKAWHRYCLLAWPLIELVGFIMLAKAIGFFMTLLLAIATSVIGVALLRNYYPLLLMLKTGNRQPMDSLGQDMIDNMGIVFAIILIIMPGFISDIMGALLFIPWVRRIFVQSIVGMAPPRQRASNSAHFDGPNDGDTIEGEYWEGEVCSKEDHPKSDQ